MPGLDDRLAARVAGETGRALVRDGFGIDRMVAESLPLYRGLLRGGPPWKVTAA